MDAAQNLPLEQRAEEYFGNEADARIGSGWWSGVIAVFCGALALGGVLCLHFPQLLSSPELRPYYPMGVIRGLIEAMIWAALGFALLAALLALVGVYGLLSFAVSRRVRELGVRMALGAGRARLLRLVLRQSAVLVIFGLAGGVALAVAVSRLLRTLLFGVRPDDPLTIAGMAAAIALAAFVASLPPALRAARIDPVVALREE